MQYATIPDNISFAKGDKCSKLGVLEALFFTKRSLVGFKLAYSSQFFKNGSLFGNK